MGLLDLKVDVVLARLEAEFSAQPPSIPAVPNRRVSLECRTAEYQYSRSEFAVLQGRELRGLRETLHFLRSNGFRVGMLEVNNVADFRGSGISIQG